MGLGLLIGMFYLVYRLLSVGMGYDSIQLGVCLLVTVGDLVLLRKVKI